MTHHKVKSQSTLDEQLTLPTGSPIGQRADVDSRTSRESAADCSRLSSPTQRAELAAPTANITFSAHAHYMQSLMQTTSAWDRNCGQHALTRWTTE